jgi:hypothetical protein
VACATLEFEAGTSHLETTGITVMSSNDTIKRGKQAARQAVGADEAAALMGVHFTTPRAMANKGKLIARSVRPGRGRRPPAIYDGSDCDRDWREYERNVESGLHRKRERAHAHRRPVVLKHLASVEHRIEFDDSIGVQEAADILGVHPSLVPRMARKRQIVGRIAWSERATASRLWIVSRKSCVANLKEIRQREAAGKKTGVKRSAKKS